MNSEELPLCACGCGKKVRLIKNKYIKGHIYNIETRRNMGRPKYLKNLLGE